MRFNSGGLHVYGGGSSMQCGRIPSEEILAICSEYAYDVDGLALLIYRVVTSPGNGDTPYGASDRAYRACDGEDSPLSFGDVSVFRSIRPPAEDYARGETPPPCGRAREAVDMRRLYDKSTRNVLAPGAIFQLYEKYMAPGAFDVEGISTNELERYAMEATTRRFLPEVSDDFPRISIRGGPRLFLMISFLEAAIFYDAVCRMVADLIGVTTTSSIMKLSSIFDVLRIDAPILEIAKIELIFVNGAEKLDGQGGILFTPRRVTKMRNLQWANAYYLLRRIPTFTVLAI